MYVSVCVHDAGSARADVIGPRLYEAICSWLVIYVEVRGFDEDTGDDIVDMKSQLDGKDRKKRPLR